MSSMSAYVDVCCWPKVRVLCAHYRFYWVFFPPPVETPWAIGSQLRFAGDGCGRQDGASLPNELAILTFFLVV